MFKISQIALSLGLCGSREDPVISQGDSRDLRGPLLAVLMERDPIIVRDETH
jgi:hypothetical protein